MIIPDLFYGISYVLVFPTSLEFVIAQFPHEMRSLLVGLWYAAYGLVYFIEINGKYPFNCKDVKYLFLCCEKCSYSHYSYGFCYSSKPIQVMSEGKRN